VQLEGGFDGPAGVVLVGGGNAEERQYFVAHELVDDTSVALHDLHRLGLDAAHDPLNFLWIELFVHGRVA